MLPAVRLMPMGDQALIIEFGNRIDPELSARIAGIAARLRESRPPGVLDIVPAYSTLTLHYDPAAVGSGTSPYEALAQTIGEWLEDRSAGPAPSARVVEIPVCYDTAFGEDLEEVARRCGVSADEVVALHSKALYHVHMLGYIPGFAYLGGLDARLAIPRRTIPRARVPAGSVAIADEQTGVYPLDAPGGWNLIGRTPLRLFRPGAAPPCLLDAGDTVRFVRISAQEFAAQSQDSP